VKDFRPRTFACNLPALPEFKGLCALITHLVAVKLVGRWSQVLRLKIESITNSQIFAELSASLIIDGPLVSVHTRYVSELT